jgi:hypothetical protein
VKGVTICCDRCGATTDVGRALLVPRRYGDPELTDRHGGRPPLAWPQPGVPGGPDGGGGRANRPRGEARWPCPKRGEVPSVG